jgi:hypothetical protein
MATTYKLISSVTVGSGGAANIDLTSIPATYTDILIVGSLRNSGDSAGATVTVNNSTSGYTSRRLYGDGSSAASDSYVLNGLALAGGANASSYTANTFSNFVLYIPNYAGSNYKSISSDSVTENNSTGAYMSLIATLWSNTAAITSVQLIPGAGNFVQYSTAYLYGISNA